MEWPPYSPDLYPIEHMWFPLKEGVYDVTPDIENRQGPDEKKGDFLWEALEQSWGSIRRIS
jgi:transposase